MDIFPANLIDNIIAHKNFSAELPADFTGGLVNIETKAFPEQKIFKVSVDAGYNPQMHLNSNYLTYKGGKTDFLGFDDGTRALPRHLLRLRPQYLQAGSLYILLLYCVHPIQQLM